MLETEYLQEYVFVIANEDGIRCNCFSGDFHDDLPNCRNFRVSDMLLVFSLRIYNIEISIDLNILFALVSGEIMIQINKKDSQ